MRIERQRRRSGPGAFQHHVLEAVFDELANARAAIDMRDDLQEEIWRGQTVLHGREIGAAMLVAHGAGRDAHLTVIERADQRVDLGLEARTGELLGEAPELAAAGDGSLIVQEHAMGVAALASLK